MHPLERTQCWCRVVARQGRHRSTLVLHLVFLDLTPSRTSVPRAANSNVLVVAAHLAVTRNKPFPFRLVKWSLFVLCTPTLPIQWLHVGEQSILLWPFLGVNFCIWTSTCIPSIFQNLLEPYTQIKNSRTRWQLKRRRKNLKSKQVNDVDVDSFDATEEGWYTAYGL